MELKKEQEKKEDLDIKKQKKESIKFLENAMEQSKMKEMESKKLQLKIAVEERVWKEHEERLKIEAEISRMEQEENEMIQKLKHTELLVQSGFLLVKYVEK